MFEQVLNSSLKSECFLDRLPQSGILGIYRIQREVGNSVRNLLLIVTKLQYRIANNDVNKLQFSESKDYSYGSLANDFSYFNEFDGF